MTPPRIVCIPQSDAELASQVREVASRLPSELSNAEALDWFSAELRRALPAARVRPQHELARTQGQPAVWYVARRLEPFRINLSVRVPLPSWKAFDIYVGRVTDWQTSVALVPRHVTPELVGTEYDATYDFLGFRYRGTLRVLAADPPQSISLEAGGSGISVAYTTTFEADGDGTIVHVLGNYSLPNHLLARVADRLLLERAINRDIERANHSYRRLCESIIR